MFNLECQPVCAAFKNSFINTCLHSEAIYCQAVSLWNYCSKIYRVIIFLFQGKYDRWVLIKCQGRITSATLKYSSVYNAYNFCTSIITFCLINHLCCSFLCGISQVLCQLLNTHIMGKKLLFYGNPRSCGSMQITFQIRNICWMLVDMCAYNSSETFICFLSLYRHVH